MTDSTDKKREVPRVAVCIPTYNYGRFLGDAIDSVLAQTFTDFELIICDNASSDNTEEVVSAYKDPRIRYFRYRIHVPVVHNFNRCLELVDSELLLVLCADDMLEINTLELLVDALDSNRSAALAMAHIRRNVNEQGQQVGEVHRLQCGPGLVRGRDVLISECCGDRSVGIPSQVLARSAVVLEYSGFDPVAGNICDVDLYCRMCEHWDVVYPAEAGFRYRNHPETETRRRFAHVSQTKARFLVTERLFQTSTFLKGNRAARRAFTRKGLYVIFVAAFDDLRRGNARALVWLIARTLRFEPLPWWLPYYLCRYVIDRLSSLVRRLRIVTCQAGNQARAAPG